MTKHQVVNLPVRPVWVHDTKIIRDAPDRGEGRGEGRGRGESAAGPGRVPLRRLGDVGRGQVRRVVRRREARAVDAVGARRGQGLGLSLSSSGSVHGHFVDQP